MAGVGLWEGLVVVNVSRGGGGDWGGKLEGVCSHHELGGGEGTGVAGWEGWWSS